MRKVWLVIKREYLTRVRSKGFIIATFLLPIFLIGIIAVTAFFAARQPMRTAEIAIVDEIGGLAPIIEQGLDQKLPNGQPAYRIVQVLETLTPGEEERVREEWRARVSQGKLDGFLIIPRGVVEGTPASYHTRNPGDLSLTSSVRRALTNAAIARRLKERGVEAENVSDLIQSAKLTLVKITEEGEVEEKGQTLATALVVMLLMYLTVLVYGLTTMRSVMEEKTTRTIEVLVSSVRPVQLLAGKMLGVAGVGFTQYLIWAVCGALLLTYGGALAAALNPGSNFPRLQFPISLLVYMLTFYLLGYFLYAALYAAAGAMVSSDEDAQQVQMPMTLLIAVSALLFGAVLRQPNSTFSIVVSLIPFFSPVLMVERIAVQTPPSWQIALSILISILTTVGVLYLAAKIYRVGILMYGKRPALLEVFRWLRYT